MKPRKRPERVIGLWMWVTDGQYEKCHGLPDNLRQKFSWWWRENLVEVPVKRALCLIYGHEIVPCYVHDHRYCLYCNYSPKQET